MPSASTRTGTSAARTVRRRSSAVSSVPRPAHDPRLHLPRVSHVGHRHDFRVPVDDGRGRRADVASSPTSQRPRLRCTTAPPRDRWPTRDDPTTAGTLSSNGPGTGHAKPTCSSDSDTSSASCPGSVQPGCLRRRPDRTAARPDVGAPRHTESHGEVGAHGRVVHDAGVGVDTGWDVHSDDQRRRQVRAHRVEYRRGVRRNGPEPPMPTTPSTITSSGPKASTTRPPAPRRAASPPSCARSGASSTADTAAPRRARMAPA